MNDSYKFDVYKNLESFPNLFRYINIHGQLVILPIYKIEDCITNAR